MIILLLVFVAFSANASDFRDVEWGMSKIEVAGREDVIYQINLLENNKY
jgi:hypothetical protein